VRLDEGEMWKSVVRKWRKCRDLISCKFYSKTTSSTQDRAWLPSVMYLFDDSKVSGEISA